jgi:hypothetical protein
VLIFLDVRHEKEGVNVFFQYISKLGKYCSVAKTEATIDEAHAGWGGVRV